MKGDGRLKSGKTVFENHMLERINRTNLEYTVGKTQVEIGVRYEYKLQGSFFLPPLLRRVRIKLNPPKDILHATCVLQCQV